MKNKLTLQPTEHQTQQLIMNYLRMKGWYVMRLNSGKYSVGEGRNRRFIMGQEAGTPDLLCFKDNFYGKGQDGLVSVCFIEVKAGKNKPTALQTAKMEELEQYGARCIVAYGIEDIQKIGL